jgi:integrase/recombinase XerC
MQLQEALGQFQVQLAADGRSEHTRKQYARHGRAFATWLAERGHAPTLAHITPNIVAEFFSSDAARMSARGGTKKATSANAQRTSLRCFFRWAHESGLVAANPARLLRRARCTPPPPRGLHADEQRRLLDVLAATSSSGAERDRMLVELLLGTGIRIGSALALDVPDIDFTHGEVALRKTKNDTPTTVVLPAKLGTRLQTFVGNRTLGPLFLAGNRRVSLRHTQRRLACLFARAGIRGRSAHSLRHSFATELLARTGDLRLVQAAMNHASIMSTTAYTLIDKAKLRSAVGG